jgi:hypothetical protein
MKDGGQAHGSNVFRYARLAARLVVPARRLADGAPDPGDREGTVAAVADALRRRGRHRTRRRWMMAGAAVAAVAVLALGLAQLARETTVTARLTGGPPLPAGSFVRADPDRPVEVSLSTGTRLRLSGSGRLTLAEVGPRQRFMLETGRVWAKVAPLAPHHRFVISTPDAEVEVRGTSFEVAVVPERGGCQGATEVHVAEGSVIVRRRDRLWLLTEGRHWMGECPAEAEPSKASPPEAAEPAGRAPPAVPYRRPSATMRARASLAPAQSTLHEQNDLFAAAMKARRRGDLAASRRMLDDLLARFPFGALADSARSELADLHARPARSPDAP